MNLLKRVLPYYKDFIFQSIVFYILYISPLGSVGWKIGVFDESLIARFFLDIGKEPLQSLLHLIYYLPCSILYSFPVSISNIYLWHFNKFRMGESDYLPLKILFMIAVSGLYIAYLSGALDHFGNVTLIFLFPIALTTLFYLVWLFWREKRHIT